MVKGTTRTVTTVVLFCFLSTWQDSCWSVADTDPQPGAEAAETRVTTDLILELHLLVKFQQRMLAVFVDLKNAFDLVHHKAL